MSSIVTYFIPEITMESSLPGLLEERQAVNPSLSPTLLLPATTTPIWAEVAVTAAPRQAATEAPKDAAGPQGLCSAAKAHL